MTQENHFVSLGQAKPPFFVGVDLAGGNITVGVVDDLGRPLCRLTFPDDSDKGPEQAAQRMGAAVLEAVRKAGLKPSAIARVGIGLPNMAGIAARRPVRPTNDTGGDNFPTGERVGAHCGLPVSLAHQANAAAYGEFWVGAGRGFHSMVLCTLGPSIGCGIVIADLASQGENNRGADFGHMIIDCSDNARLCECGQPGHLDAYASATAIVKRAREALDAGRESPLSGCPRISCGAGVSPALAAGTAAPQNSKVILGQPLSKRLAQRHTLTFPLIAQEAEAGDPLSLELVADAARHLGVGVVNLMNTIDPNGILLGGTMTFGGRESPLGRKFLGWVREEVARRAFTVLAERTVVDFAALGGDAGCIGAAGIARLEIST
jgi:glucokinase